MPSTDLTNAEVSYIDRAVVACGGGAMLRCELLTWAFYVKESGDAIQRDTLALFMGGNLRPLPMLDGEGNVVFVPTRTPYVIDVGCSESAMCVLDDGHDGDHRIELGAGES